MRIYKAVITFAVVFAMTRPGVGDNSIITSDGPVKSASSTPQVQVIVTSDGPGTSKPLPAQKVVVSDGPSTSTPAPAPKVAVSDALDSKSASRASIVTTNGPAKLPYVYPPPIIITNGPDELPYDINAPAQIEYSEGPGMQTTSDAAATKREIVVSDGPGTQHTARSKAVSHHAKAENSSVPAAETSALAPVSAFENLGATAGASARSSASRPFGLTGTHATSRKESFNVYSDEQNSGNHFHPSGWMGDYHDISMNAASDNHPHGGNTCIQITYSARGAQGNGWAGIYWQTPANNWGDKPGGYDLTGKRRLTFWARGEKGGEVIAEFKMGGIQGENSDSTSASTGSIVLTDDWQKYTISLADLDLTHIIGGFCWTASRQDNPDGITFYLDDIRYE